MSHAATASASPPPPPVVPPPSPTSTSTPPTPASSPSTPISSMSITSAAAGDSVTPQSVLNNNDIGTGAVHVPVATASLLQVPAIPATTMEALKNVLVGDSSLSLRTQQQQQQQQHQQRENIKIYGPNSNGDGSSSKYFHDNSGNTFDDNEDVDTIVTIRTSNVTANNNNNNNNNTNNNRNSGLSSGNSENDHGTFTTTTSNNYDHYQGRRQHQQQITYDNTETEAHKYFQKQIIMFHNNNDSHGDSASGGSTATSTTARTNNNVNTAPNLTQQLNQNPNQNQHYLRSTIPSPIQPLTPSFTLPQELKKILYEVSKTGKCSSLPWTAASSKSSSSSSLYLGGGGRGGSSRTNNNNNNNNNNRTSKSNEKRKRRALRNKNKKRNSQHHTAHQSNHVQKKRVKRHCNSDGGSIGGGGPDGSDNGGISLNQLVSSSLQSSLRPNDCSSNNNSNGESLSSSPSSVGAASATGAATTTTTIITSGNVVQQAQQYSLNNQNQNLSSSSSSPDTGQGKMITTSQQQHQQLQQKRFNTENGEKYSYQPQQHHHLNEGRNDKKSQQQSHQKGEDGDVSSLSSTLSYASKKSFSSTAGTYKQNRSRFHNKDFHPTSYTSSCSESISSKGEGSTISAPSSSASMAPLIVSLPFRTLRGALRLAVALVLEQAYKHRGGYKLSPAEKRRFEVLHQYSRMRASSLDGNNKQKPSPSSSSLSPREQNYFYGEYSVNPSQMDIAFTERRMRILQMLGGGKNSRSSSSSSHHVSEYTSDSGSSLGSTNAKGSKLYNLAEGQQHCTGPPFTIQRVAEVLLMPERYYSQTHKLCNALEKLLLVTTPSSAFGGVKGGDTSQNRREEQELAAFQDKKVKDETEQRQRRLKQRMSLSSNDSGGDPVLRMNVSVEEPDSKRSLGNNNIGQPLAYGVSFSNTGANSGNAVTMHNDHDHSNRLTSPNALLGDSQMMLSVLGATPGSPDSLLPTAVENSIYQNDGGTVRANVDSFSPDSLQQRANIARFGNLSGDINRDISVGNVRGADPSSPSVLHPSVQRPLSPSLLMINGHHHQSHTDLQAHHSPDLGLSGAGQRVQMEIVITPTTNLGVSNGSSQSNQVVTSADVADLEGRSSASNSDVDSESDDVSFDDSASDRSDGSDSGSGYFSSEPFTAARVMALNRMQQQHRREQYLQDRALRQLAASSSNFQPPPDSEYQSGDSIDSTLAEDSCGSDSSSSDVAD